MIADALIELGRYDEAVVATQRMVDLRPDLASFARVSYLRELMGDVPGALAAMERAAQAGAGRAENVAWTQVQSGNLRFNSGDLDGAAARYDASLATVDGYVYGAGRDGPGRGGAGRFPGGDRVLHPGRRADAAAGVRDRARRGLRGGRDARPRRGRQYALVGAMIRLYADNGVDTDIELALFLADHGGEPGASRRSAMAEAGYEAPPEHHVGRRPRLDAAQGRPATEAQRYAREALRLGTRDASLSFHAGMIEAALGNTDAATGLPPEALAINPFFSPLHAPQASEMLSQLRGAA